MAKVAKAVGTVAGVVAAGALLASGFGVGAAGLLKVVMTAATATSLVANVGSQILAKKPPAQGSVTQTTIGTSQDACELLGRTYSPGARVHLTGYGAKYKDVQNPYLLAVDVVSVGGPVESLEQCLSDFAPITFSGTAAQGYFGGFLWRSSQLGAQREASALPLRYAGAPGWGANARLSGKAAIAWNALFDAGGKVFSGGFPQVGSVWRGVKAYDPRKDSTYPGGMGPHRWADPSDTAAFDAARATWEYTTSPGLLALRNALGTWERDEPTGGRYRKVFGAGIPIDGLIVEDFVHLANVCDANGWKVGGRIFEPGNRWDNLKRILAAGGAEPAWRCGRLGVKVQAPRIALDTITANDLADDGDVVVGAMQGWEQRLNTLVPKYRSEAHRWEYVPANAIQITSYLAEDGEEKSEERQIDLVQDATQARQLCAYELMDRRELGEIELPCKPRLRRYGPGDLLIVDIPEAGLVAQPAVVLRRSLNPETMGVSLVLRGETLEKHAFALAATGEAPPTPGLRSTEDIDATLSSTNLVDWSQVRDPDGTRPDDNATVGGTIGQNIKLPSGYILTADELLNSALDLRPDGRLIAKIGGAERVLGTLTLPDMGAASDQARRQLETDLATMAAALAQLATGEQIVRQYLADAGLYTDPASGKAKLFAIEQRAEQISKLSVDLNAALGEIGLKATVSYVNEAILKAQLSGNADLGGLLVRLTSAETIISGLQASIIQKADATIVTGLQGTVTAVQQSIDAINAELSLKASRTTVDSMGQRLNVVETEFRALDGASITQSAMVTRRVPAEADAAGANAILDMLNGHAGLSMTTVAIASAKSDLRALVDSNTSAIAAQGFQLGVQIGGVTSLVASEQSARIAGDQASASALAAYRAANDQAVATVQSAITTQSDRTTSLAGRFDTLTAKIGDFGQVTIAQSFTALADRTGKLEGQYTFAIDTNGHVVGWRALGATSGFGTLALFNMDISMGTGRIIFDNGQFMQVQGLGFGRNRDLLSWYGPTMPIELCSRSNGLEWKGTDGVLYTAAAIKAGPYVNSGTSTLIAADAAFSLGPFTSNGGPKAVVASYTFRRRRQVAPGGGGAATGAPSATLVLEYQSGPNLWAHVATIQTGNPVVTVIPATGEDPGILEESMSGSVTWTDTRTMLDGYLYRLRLTARQQASFTGTAQGADSITQSLSIVSQE